MVEGAKSGLREKVVQWGRKCRLIGQKSISIAKGRGSVAGPLGPKSKSGNPYH